ncbi:unnamed protein product [Symbiodinium natans]|uniref:Glycosyl transferase family 25 domain-containing protein n=1 Tax=Symbiodinium natans TaxID=878477 RepID=A0A812NXT9_9DINO|nr:unnamed protein product [Symbiodinium natans]
MSKYHALGYLSFAACGFLGGYFLHPLSPAPPVLLPSAPPAPPGPSAEPWEGPRSEATAATEDFRCRPLDHVFVINLEGPLGEARRVHAVRELAKVGLHGRYRFWPAVSAYDDASLAKELGKKHCPCDPQSALALSHRRIYEAILAKRWPCATIFEDDVSLARNFSRRLEAVSASLPPFDTLQLGYCKSGKKVGVGPKDQTSLPILKYGWPGACLHAAVISLQGAALLAEVNTPLRTHADGAMDPKHWPNHTRTFLDRKPGAVPGSYWYTEPMLAWQGADDLVGGA